MMLCRKRMLLVFVHLHLGRCSLYIFNHFMLLFLSPGVREGLAKSYENEHGSGRKHLCPDTILCNESPPIVNTIQNLTNS
jgi:hypothetical protein